MKKLLFLFILLVLIVVSYNLIVSESLSNEPKPLTNSSIKENLNSSNLNSEEICSIIEYGNNFVIAAHYPMFGISNIDLITQNLIQDHINNFNLLVKNHFPEDNNYKSELSIDYEIFYFSTRIVSIKFNIFEFMSYYPNPSLTTSTISYDLKAKEVIDLEEIIEDIPVVILSQENPKSISKEATN